jgi:hypothetical protein
MGDEDRDHSECEIVWHGEPPSQERLALIRGDIKISLCDLDEPSDLVFHIVFLEEAHEGATATLWGDPDDKGKFHAEWSPTTEWVPLSEL